MQPIHVPWLGVLAGFFIQMALGWWWYSPAGFGKRWMGYLGIKMPSKMTDKMKKEAGRSMGVMALMSLVAALCLAFGVVIVHAVLPGLPGVLAGLMVGFWAWVGFLMTNDIGPVLWEKKPVGLFLLNTGYHFVVYLAMGAVLGALA